MICLNLEIVKEVLKTQKTIEVYHDLEKPTTYKPVKAGIAVVRNNEIIAIIDKNLKARYLKYPTTVTSSKREEMIRKTFKITDNISFEAQFSDGVYLTNNGSTHRLEIFINDKIKNKQNAYIDLIKLIKDPLISAYFVTHGAVFRVKPLVAFSIADAETILKMALFSSITKIKTFKYVDVLKFSKTPLHEILEALKPIAMLRIPFESIVPIYYSHNGFEFYANDGVYFVLKKNKNGKIIDVKANVCGDYADTCETIKELYSKIAQTIEN